jgi:exodeoxyribonuclease V alpha subunit
MSLLFDDSKMDVKQIPMDRGKREHVGKVARVLWADLDQPCCLLKLQDDKVVVIDEHPQRFEAGTVYRFLGQWVEGKRGPQFRAETFTQDTPANRVGVVRYLTEVCEGIGQKTAERLFSQYGPDAIRVLRESPEQVAADGLLSAPVAAEAAASLADCEALERTKTDLFTLFAGRGFPGKTIDRCIARWGAKAPEVVRRDPFKLLTNHITGCGWKRCDKLHADLGLNRGSLKRCALAGWNALTEDRTGSTWLPAAVVHAAIRDAVPECHDITRAMRMGIRAGVFRLRREEGETYMAIAEHARDEQRVADAVRRLMAVPSPMSLIAGEIQPSQNEGDGLPSQHQVDEIRKALSGSIGCLIGGPGTGKSYTVAEALKRIGAEVGMLGIAVAAPTGKAAGRITEYMRSRGLKLKATTIHSLLEIGRNGHDGRGWGFQRNRTNPLSHRVIVIDEASMIDAGLMADLLDAAPTGACVLFVGDPFQLAPVGHGAPLRDLLASGVVPFGELTETRRNAGLIVRACAAIKAGQRPETAERLDLDAADPVNLRFVEARGGAEVLDFVERVLGSMTRFDPVWQTQILCPTNGKSDLSRVAVNQRFAKLLNPNGKRADGLPFAVGDKVICLRNTRLRTVQLAVSRWSGAAPTDPTETASYEPNGEESMVRNGDLGRVVAVSTKGMIVAFGESLVAVPKSKPKATGGDGGKAADAPSEVSGAMGDFEHAYAITGHKSQGSQWPCVIVLADKAGSGVADRNWWYTVLSRAEKACLVVGDRAAFESQAKRVTMALRKTLLRELLASPVAGAEGGAM